MAEERKDNSEGGELIFAGSVSFSMTNRSKKSSMWDGVEEKFALSFCRIRAFVDVKIQKVISGPIAHHFIAVSADGEAYTWGRNESGQLGLGDYTNRYKPTPLDLTLATGEVVTNAACSSGHTLVCTSSRSLYGWGDNGVGQLGLGRTSDSVKEPKLVEDISAISISAGKDFSVIVSSAGQVFTCGCPEHGVLGHGTEAKSLERAGKFTFANETRPKLVQRLAGVDMAMVASGSNFTIAADEAGKVYSWGFNGYGQLGLGDNKNRLEPAEVEFFHVVAAPKPPNVPKFMWRPKPEYRASQISCGSSCTYVVGKMNQTMFFWGIRKKTNEATMRPTLYDGLQGWKIKSVAVGLTSTVCSATAQEFPHSKREEALITWGASPTYGELGYGEGQPKSSTVEKKVEYLDGADVIQVAAGAAYSLAIVSLAGKGAELIQPLSVLEPEEVSAEHASSGMSAKERKKKRKPPAAAKKKKAAKKQKK